MQFDRARMLAVLPDVAVALSDDTAFEDGSPDKLKAWLDVGLDTVENWALAMREASQGHDEYVYAIARMALAAGAPEPRQISGDHRIAPRSAEVYGELKIEGSLRVSGTLIVAGNLEVAELVLDCDPDSRVAIAGDLRCGSLATDGAFYVGGCLSARHAVYVHRSDKSLLIGGDLCSQVFLLDDGHDVRFGGELKTDLGIDEDLSDLHRDAELRARVTALLTEGLVSAEGIIQSEALIERLAAGRSILR